MAEEILKNIPVETKWAITTQSFVGAYSAIIQLAGPHVGQEKLIELNNTVFVGGSKIAFPRIKESFNIPVEDAIGAANLIEVVSELQMGTESEGEYVEKTPARVVYRQTKCPWGTWNEENAAWAKPEYMICTEGHQAWAESGLKAINPKLTHKMTKSMMKGDPYCEYIIEFKK
ncbi:MAG: hypothetical protein ACFFCD_13300 [Promethearchaeota archaeon]